jgi:hypothetical protein
MPRPTLQARSSPLTINALAHSLHSFNAEYARHEYPWAQRFVMGLPLAPWQREFKWSMEQVQRFITSAWTGVHLGSYILTATDLRNEDQQFRGVEYLPLSNMVIDGQQRLQALELYLTDRVLVPDEQGNPVRWSEVEPHDQRRFRNTVFSRSEIPLQSEMKLRGFYDTFNFGGVAHAAHERATFCDLPSAQAPALARHGVLP